MSSQNMWDIACIIQIQGKTLSFYFQEERERERERGGG